MHLLILQQLMNKYVLAPSLKHNLNGQNKAKLVMGGDDNQSQILLIPIKELIGSVGEIF